MACELYRSWEARLSPTMRQAHPAGERRFVDYAGQRWRWWTAVPASCARRRCSSLCWASNYTYAEATRTEPAGLDRFARAHAGVPRRRSAADRAGQPARRRLAANWYEPGINPTCRDPGGALRHGDPADASAAAPRQGQGRGRRAGGGALDPGAAAQPALLLAGRTQPCDRGPGSRPQCAADAQAWRQPPSALRGAGPAGAVAATGGALRLRRVAHPPRRARLSCRCRRPLLFRPAPPAARAGRGTHHHPHADRGPN